MSTDDRMRVLDDDLVVEPASVAWARRLNEDSGALATVHDLATDTARLLAHELRADHVALWAVDRDDFVILGAQGLNPRLRRTRLPSDDPAVTWTLASNGLRRWTLTGPDRLPRTTAVPDSRSSDYAMLAFDDDDPVDLVTVSGVELGDGAVTEVRRLMRALEWPVSIP